MKNLKTNILSFLFIATFLSLSFQTNGQAWQRAYPGDAVSADVEQTIDGGFVVSRYLSKPIFKVDGQGNLLWEYAPSGSIQVSNVQSLEVLTDGSIIGVGQASSTNPIQQHLFFVKLDNDGTVVWNIFYLSSVVRMGRFWLRRFPVVGFILVASMVP